MEILSLQNNKQLQFLSDSLGNPITQTPSNQILLDWYEECCEESSWRNYLVVYKGEFGLLSILEFSLVNYNLMSSIENSPFLDEHSFLEHVKALAVEFQSRTEFPIFLGEKTSAEYNHEIAIYFPYKTNQLIVNAFQRGFSEIQINKKIKD